MSGNQNETRSDYSKFDSMTNDELEEILRLDAEKPEDESSDLDMLMYVMGVLAKRRRNSAKPGKTPVEAYQSFVAHYAADDAEVTTENIHNTVTFKPRQKRNGWKRLLTAVAACAAIVCCGVVTTTVLGYDTLEQFFDWTKEVFSFSEPEQTELSGLSGDYELVDDTWENVLSLFNVPANLMPNNPPDGYTQIDVAISETPQARAVIGHFENGEKYLRMTVRDHLAENQCMIERAEEAHETYDYCGVTYFFFSNSNKVRVVWVVDAFECMLYGNLSLDEMKALIHSIQEG